MDHLLETILLTQQSIHYIHHSTIHTCFKRTLSNINSVPNVNQSCLIKDTISHHCYAQSNTTHIILIIQYFSYGCIHIDSNCTI